MKKLLILVICFNLLSCNSNPIKSSLRKDDFLKEIIKDKEEYQIQILLTEINQNNTQFDFNEYEYQLDDNQYFYPASTNASDIVATVYADPYIVYEAQHDGTGTAAMNNSAFDFVGTSGSTLSGQSTSEIDTSTSGTSGGFKQIGISKDPDNSDTSSANANAYVVFNTGEHVFKLTTGV